MSARLRMPGCQRLERLASLIKVATQLLRMPTVTSLMNAATAIQTVRAAICATRTILTARRRYGVKHSQAREYHMAEWSAEDLRHLLQGIYRGRSLRHPLPLRPTYRTPDTPRAP